MKTANVRQLRHAFGEVMSLIDDCRREKTVRPLPVPMLAMFAMSTMGLPNIVVTAFEANGLKKIAGEPIDEFKETLLCDKMIEIRADMVLAALAPEKGK